MAKTLFLKMPLFNQRWLKKYVFSYLCDLWKRLDCIKSIITKVLALSSKTIKLYGANQKILKAQKMISQGCEIATAFGVAGVFSDFALSQISTAEKSGELSKAYEAIASDYKQNCITKIDTILKSIEPAMLFVVSICVVVLGVKMYTKYYQTLLNLF